MGSETSIIGMLYIPVLLYNTISDSIIFMLLSHLYIIDRSSIRSSSSSSRYSFLCYRSVYYSFISCFRRNLHDDARWKKDEKKTRLRDMSSARSSIPNTRHITQHYYSPYNNTIFFTCRRYFHLLSSLTMALLHPNRLKEELVLLNLV